MSIETAAEEIPAAVSSPLYINQFMLYDFPHSRLNTVDRTDPRHLIPSFQVFSHAFRIFHFLGQVPHQILCLLLDVGKMIVQLPGEQ